MLNYTLGRTHPAPGSSDASRPFTALEKGGLAWHAGSCNNIGHGSQPHLCPSKSRETFSRAEGAQCTKIIQSRMNLIAIFQLPAVQKVGKKNPEIFASQLKKFLLETYTSLKLQGERFPCYFTINLVWSAGVPRDLIYIVMLPAEWGLWGEVT